MKKLLAVIFAIATLTGVPALAADMPLKALSAAPVPPPWTWSGAYVGINGGYGWNRNTGNGTCINPGGVIDGPGCTATTDNVISPRGGLFGAQAGYNWQAGPFVTGIETDIQWTDIKASGSVVDPCCNPVPAPATARMYSATAQMNWFGTTRARIGLLTTPNLLAYVTGGAIYGEESVSQTTTFAPGGLIYPSSTATTHAGGVAGGGLEFAFNRSLSAKVEGLLYDMGSLTSSYTCPPAAATCVPGYTHFGTFSMRGEILRAGLNWHLGDR